MMKIPTTKNKWSLKTQILTLFYAYRDNKTPWYAKLTTLLALIYLLSPVDIIPDIVPFAGFLDDVIIVPLLMAFSSKLLPQDVKDAAELKARKSSKKAGWLLALFVVLFIALMAGLFYLVLYVLQPAAST